MVTLTTDLQLKIDDNAWSAIIAECSKRGRHKLAEDYFDVMLESGVEPSVFTWTALIQAIARGDNHNRFDELLFRSEVDLTSSNCYQ